MADIKEVAFNHKVSDVAIPTTTETVVLSSGLVSLPFHTCHIIVLAWCQLVSGTGTTDVTPRIRRGTTTAGALVGEANAEVVKTAAGSREPFMIMVHEERAGEEAVEYCLTIQQTAATANGTVNQAAIIVLVL